jgi:hypothetical protein
MMLRYTLGNLVFLSGLTSYITIIIIIIRFPVATGAILISTRKWKYGAVIHLDVLACRVSVYLIYKSFFHVKVRN